MGTFTGTNGNDTLIGTSGADSFFPLLGLDLVTGGLGFDLLTVNYAALFGVTATILADPGAASWSGTIANVISPVTASVTFSGIEALALSFTAGNDLLGLDAAPLAAGATLQLDGGAGFDVLQIDFSALTGTIFTQAPTFLVTSNRGTFTGWDQFEIALGAGDNRVTTQSGADVIRTTGGNDTINTGAGADVIWSVGSVDVINGGTGVDQWHGDYSAFTSTLGFAYDTSAGYGYMTNGTTLAGIEGGSIVTGSADDSFLLMGLGRFHVDGGAGEDWLTWDDTGDFGLPYWAAFDDGGIGAAGQGMFSGQIASATFANMERINAALGDGDNYAYVDTAPLALGATINLSGGLGYDTLAVDFTAFAWTSIVVAADGSVAASRGTWLDFEAYRIALGPGANLVTTGAGDDQLYSAGGADTVDGGAGADEWYGDYSATPAALAFTWNGAAGSGTLSNGTVLAAIEYASVETGAGNDTFLLSGPLPADVFGGAGVDRLVRNDTGLAGVDPIVFVLAAGDAFYGSVANGGFDAIEQLDLTLSDDDNLVYVTPAPLLAGATLRIDGGAGVDQLRLNLGAMPGSLLTLAPDGSLAGNRGTYAGFESRWIGLGAGANSVTLGAGNDTVEAGFGGANLIALGAGDDEVWGGTGNDTVDGGTGADLFRVSGRLADYAITRDGLGGYMLTDLNPVDGNDGVDRLTAVEQIVFADGAALLPAYDPGLILTGTAGADLLTGSPYADRLSGLAGNDTLDGGPGDDWLSGGPGDDRLTGGAGFDTLDYAEAPSAVKLSLAITGTAQATGGGGADTLVDLIEAVTGSPFADTLTGNTLANRLEGGAGNDTLDGGSGADTLVGGPGNDLYKVDNAADVIVELAGEGTDTVTATVTHTLAANVENLTLAGTAVFSGTGNPLANVLTGNAAANLLTGLEGNDTLDGGAGADTLVGGPGNDTYKVDNAADVIVEAPGEGTDLVSAAVSFTLPAEVESLTLTGTAALTGTGNAAANSLLGNGGANLLSGLAGNDTLNGGAGTDTLIGGAGADTLTGGTGADTFVVDILETAANRDAITDFAHLADHLAFARSAFAALASLPPGVLDQAQFALGAAATTAQQHLVYTQGTGSLYYDVDGAGGAAQILVATLTTKPVLSAADFLIL